MAVTCEYNFQTVHPRCVYIYSKSNEMQEDSLLSTDLAAVILPVSISTTHTVSPVNNQCRSVRDIFHYVALFPHLTLQSLVHTQLVFSTLLTKKPVLVITSTQLLRRYP